jgi:hypothetical protein
VGWALALRYRGLRRDVHLPVWGDRLPWASRDKPNISQDVEGPSLLIELLSQPGELVCDPFCGTAQWGHAAVERGWRWLGADLELGGTTRIEAGDLDEEAS